LNRFIEFFHLKIAIILIFQYYSILEVYSHIPSEVNGTSSTRKQHNSQSISSLACTSFFHGAAFVAEQLVHVNISSHNDKTCMQNLLSLPRGL
jgi:hypothetical protein